MRQIDNKANQESCDQSILVSGESEAGKTVTAKFFMKYLSALSQRAASQKQPEKRAYLKVAEKRKSQHRRKRSTSLSKFTAPSWAVNSSKSQDSDRQDCLTNVIVLGGNAGHDVDAQRRQHPRPHQQ